MVWDIETHRVDARVISLSMDPRLSVLHLVTPYMSALNLHMFYDEAHGLDCGLPIHALMRCCMWRLPRFLDLLLGSIVNRPPTPHSDVEDLRRQGLN